MLLAAARYPSTWTGIGQYRSLAAKPRGAGNVQGKLMAIRKKRDLRQLIATVEEDSGTFSPVNITTALGDLTKWRAAPGQRKAVDTAVRVLEAEMLRSIGLFPARNLSSCIHSLAKGGMGEDGTFTAVAAEAVIKMPHFIPQGLANTVSAFAKAGHSAPHRIKEGRGAVPGCGKGPHSVGQALWDEVRHLDHCLCRHRIKEGRGAVPGFGKGPHSVGQLLRVEVRHLGHCCYRALFDAVAAEAVVKMPHFIPQGLANTVWAFATAGHSAPALFDAVAVAAVTKVPHFNPQELANTVWAFAKAGHSAPALFDAVAAEALTKMPHFIPQNMANTVWAFAKAGHSAPALFDAVAAEVLTKMPHFNPQDMANTVWAFAKAGHSAPALFDAVAAEALTKMPHFIPQDIANTVWAFATAMHSAPALFDAVAPAAVTNVQRFNPQDIANTVWAFATAGHSAPALFDAVAAAAVTKMPHFIPQGLADTVWAFATARYPHSQLFDAVLQRTVLSFHSHGLMPIELSRLLLSFAKIGHPGTPDLAAFVLAGLHQLDQSLLDSQHRANILYALALSGQLQAAQLRQIASPLEEQLTELLPEGARQIFQCCLAVRMEAGIADEPPGSTLLPPALYQAARNSWTASVEATSPSGCRRRCSEPCVAWTWSRSLRCARRTGFSRWISWWRWRAAGWAWKWMGRPTSRAWSLTASCRPLH